MQPQSSQALSESELLEKNRSYYDMLWSGARLVEAQKFNTWPLVQSLLPTADRRLEVAPGLRPRLPIEGTQFLDISAPAIAKLRGRGAKVVIGKVTRLPSPTALSTWYAPSTSSSTSRMMMALCRRCRVPRSREGPF